MAMVELSDRHLLLILNALYILESQLFGDEVHFEIMLDIEMNGGKPTTDEVRSLMNEIKNTPEGDE